VTRGRLPQRAGSLGLTAVGLPHGMSYVGSCSVMSCWEKDYELCDTKGRVNCGIEMYDTDVSIHCMPMSSCCICSCWNGCPIYWYHSCHRDK